MLTAEVNRRILRAPCRMPHSTRVRVGVRRCCLEVSHAVLPAPARKSSSEAIHGRGAIPDGGKREPSGSSNSTLYVGCARMDKHP